MNIKPLLAFVAILAAGSVFAGDTCWANANLALSSDDMEELVP